MIQSCVVSENASAAVQNYHNLPIPEGKEIILVTGAASLGAAMSYTAYITPGKSVTSEKSRYFQLQYRCHTQVGYFQDHSMVAGYLTVTKAGVCLATYSSGGTTYANFVIYYREVLEK